MPLFHSQVSLWPVNVCFSCSPDGGVSFDSVFFTMWAGTWAGRDSVGAVVNAPMSIDIGQFLQHLLGCICLLPQLIERLEPQGLTMEWPICNSSSLPTTTVLSWIGWEVVVQGGIYRTNQWMQCAANQNTDMRNTWLAVVEKGLMRTK